MKMPYTMNVKLLQRDCVVIVQEMVCAGDHLNSHLRVILNESKTNPLLPIYSSSCEREKKR